MLLRRTIKIFLIIGLLCAMAFCLSSCIPARLKKVDVQDLQLSAQKGDAKAQVHIGEMYEFGAGVPANQTVAARWYQMAAKQNEPEAQFYLGVMYERQNGRNRKPAESLKWLFKSGEQGQEKAQIWLAGLYLKDKKLRPEFVEKIKSYRLSAEKGNATAQYTLGWIYREGVGLAINPLEAMKWYSKAAQQGNAKAQLALGRIYLEGNVAPLNPGKALAWYLKSAKVEIAAQTKLCELYRGTDGIPENAKEAKKWSKTLARNIDASLRAHIDRQYAILNSEKEKNPALAKRACQRISEFDPAYREVAGTCNALTKQISEKKSSRVSEAKSALTQKNWDRFDDLLAGLLISDFDEEQLRQIVAAAWRLIEEETRAKEKIAQEQLHLLEAAERTTTFRKKNLRKIARLINNFKATLDQGLLENPGDEALLELDRKGKKVIASLQRKMKPPRLIKRPSKEKAPGDTSGKIEEDIDPGEDEYKKAQALFNNGHFAEAQILFEKTTRIRGSGYIASAYIYLGISHLARINQANVKEARKRHLKGLSCFQNALRFDEDIILPAGYDKYQPMFDEAKKRLH